MVTVTKSALRAVSFLLFPPLPNHVIGRLPICHSNFKICQRKPMVLTFRWKVLGRIFEHYFFLLKEIWITSLKWVREMTVISDYMLSSSFFLSAFLCISERDWSIHFNVFYRLHMLLRRSFMLRLLILTLFVLFSSFHYEMTTKAKLIFFYAKDNGSLTWKVWRWAG